MIRVDITGLKEVSEKIKALDKQVRYAAALTLNKLAQYPVRDALRHEMADSLDRPTPFTLNSIALVKKATRTDPTAVIDFKDKAGGGRPAADYLRWQVNGGQRRLKAFELALRTIGVLPGGYFAVPGSGAKFDAYGNVSRGQIVAILSYFKAFPEDGRGYKMNATGATRAKMAKGTRSKLGYRYFVGRPGGRGQLGIYQDVRISGSTRELLPIFIFTESTRYQPRLDLRYAAELAVKREFGPTFAYALKVALSTAR
jgi:hypothetical protein